MHGFCTSVVTIRFYNIDRAPKRLWNRFHHLEYHLNQIDSQISRELNSNIYIDNLIIGTTSLDPACSIYHETPGAE
uniref:Uncharacterized protein n=1 Tax=Romanomermis culicivorax TaxID=13658 RepID=A0A915J765_ROMCU